MKYDITHAIQELKPGAVWSLNGYNYSGLEWLDRKQTKPTETEINNKIAELDAAEPLRLLREERNRRIALTDWRAGIDLVMSDDWKRYRQALRDLPQTAGEGVRLNSNYKLDLSSIPWPQEPEEIS
tara:strand:+ start:686 stop:1063 length:378 start_codon:yes stop_codon:yes gene_type:complete